MSVLIFSEVELSDVLRRKRASMLSEIGAEPANKLLNSNETDYVRYLVDKYQIEPVVIHADRIQASHSERQIPIEQHPPEFSFRYSHPEGRSFPRQVFTFHLPFSGDECLLKCCPSSRLLGTEDVRIAENGIQFDRVVWQKEAIDLKREQIQITELIQKQNANVTTEVEEFNLSLEKEARQAVSARKTHHLKQQDLAESLGIPLRRSDNIPRTFSIPIVPKKLAVRPASSEKAFSAHPAVDQHNYENILSVIHETGVAMERNPSIYFGKKEEDLRDFLLMMLCTHYQNTTGETFNKTGKTDILVRYEGKNAFVGECKFWTGKKGFHETIDQILSYLTWRDSKAAIVSFVTNKELDPVLQQVPIEAAHHPCYVRLESKKGESWTQFEFRLPNDPSRNVHLAVLSFHFPAS